MMDRLFRWNAWLCERLTPPLIALNLVLAVLLAFLGEWGAYFRILGMTALLAAMRIFRPKGGAS